eukprot:Tamp_25033.p1 GENE.Tamp_25033~~Tamp_25033.p1  ORF type:complete len:203 (-),score=30.00 Tamp_25033:267-875(-)
MLRLPALALCCVLGLLGAQPAATLQEFDLNDCSKEAPCCIHHQNTTKYVGSLMGGATFCHIEYPVKFEGYNKDGLVSKNWTKRVARMIDKDAQKHWEKNYKADCSKEECVGYVCATFFPRCFYVNSTHQGGFVFEECRQTCEECLGTCKDENLKAQCSSKPSQFELACTSEAWRAQLSKMILAVVTLSCLWIATMDCGGFVY